MKQLHIALALALAGGIATSPLVLAHHSFAAYDQAVTKTANGVLKEFDWNAPHSSITVAYTDEAGKQAEVSVTTGAPATMSRQGFKPRDFKAGQKVMLSWHPNRNGLPGGEMVSLQLGDGRVLNGSFGTAEGASAPAK